MNTMHICKSLDQRDLAKLLATSQPTISRRLNKLRITRWITLINDVGSSTSNLKGRQSYKINNNQLGIAETLQLDSSYCLYLVDCSENATGSIKKLSKEELFAIPEEVLKNSNILITESRESLDEPPLFTSESRENLENLDGIYNTARGCAPTHISNPYGVNINTTTTGEESGGSGFEFFQTNKIIQELVWDLEHDRAFLKKTTHAILNFLKKKTYEDKNNQQFRWICTEEKAIDLMIILRLEKPNHALAFLKTLIILDHKGEFTLKRSQEHERNKFIRSINPDYQSDKLEKLSPIQELFEYMNSNAKGEGSDREIDLSHIVVNENDVFRAVEAIPQWGAIKGSTATLTYPDYDIHKNNKEEMQLIFESKTKIAYYQNILMAINLGLLEKIDD